MDSKTPKQNEVTEAIQRMLDGDVDAYEIIYRHCDSPMRAFVRRRYSRVSPDFIDEVSVRTHERVLCRMDRFEPAGKASFQTWLNWRALSVAEHLYQEWYGQCDVHLDEEKHESWAVSKSGPEKGVQMAERSRVLGQAVESLPEDGRRCITLHDLDGLSLAQTAERLGLPLIRVRRERERMLAKLRRYLKRRRFNPIEVDATPQPIWYGRNSTRPYDEDEWTTSVGAVLPDGPDTLVGADAKDEREEVEVE